jgi:hypothetical protein
MSVVVLNDLPQGSQEFYDQVTPRVMPGGELPDGCQVHIAGPSGGGWRVITVWESEEQFQAFREETLIPAMREAGGDDFVAPSIEPDPVYNLLTA